ncbi:hypothetical protein ONZ51_g9834 [Trametes cubensis]|uniref:Uncharacterized protein n=1 Tax=Trametes cubensis TaxID=1111947 RepID=A0AAD7X5B8_9APHY|nr:hypothetical protein ONZ51_g9834 [Trametes cubensis]
MALAALPNTGSDMTPEWGTHNNVLLQTAPFASSLSSPPFPSSSSFSSMAAVASSSTPSGSRPSQRPRKPDVFKPRFPLDPFSGAPAAALGEPWFLKVDALLAATSYQRRNVIFVLGGASTCHLPPSPCFLLIRSQPRPSRSLPPLLQSRHLAKSLVILATHKPPDIPHIVLPTVRILHLSAPLALEDAGAVRFVNVLEWAERIARAWRKHGGTGVLELSEELDIDAELTPPSVLRFNGSQSTPTSPGSSSTQLSSDSLAPSRPPSLFRPHSSSSGTFLSRSTRQASQSLPKPDPSQRPFDALINFLPDHVSDKALLKNSILVTTISRPFLVANGPAPPAMRSRTASSSSSRFQRPQSIFNAFSRSSASVYLPPTPPYHSGESLSLPTPPPPGKALLLHLLPPPPSSAPVGARRKLVESIEAFLLSFAFQSISMGMPGDEALERARPYVMQTTTFCDSVGCEPGVADWGDWTVADVVLSGALDADASAGPAAGMNAAVGTMTPSASAGAGSRLSKTMAKSKASSRRAWIAAAADLVIMPSPEDGPSAGTAGGASSSQAGDTGHFAQRHGTSLRPDAAHLHPQHMQTLPRAFDRGSGTRSTSAPLLSAPASEWGPHGSGARPFSHPSHHQQLGSFSSALSRQLSPSRNKEVPALPSNGTGLPTPPHSEESECGSLDAHSTATSPGRRGGASSSSSRSASTGASMGTGEKEKEKKTQKWKFWRRLSHMPAAIKA